MGKTFRKNEGRRPKWDKFGKKSRKQREFEEEAYKHKHYRVSQPIPEPELDPPDQL